MDARLEVQHKIYLHPAELVVAAEPTEVATVLGSCISVIFFHPRRRYGAICHAVLPTGHGEHSRFVDQSIHAMLAFFARHQIKPCDLVTKVFGGADMFSQFATRASARTVGAQNISMALDTLRDLGIYPSALDIGGQQGRKLLFFSHTGEVYLKRVERDKLKIVCNYSAP